MPKPPTKIEPFPWQRLMAYTLRHCTVLLRATQHAYAIDGSGEAYTTLARCAAEFVSTASALASALAGQRHDDIARLCATLYAWPAHESRFDALFCTYLPAWAAYEASGRQGYVDIAGNAFRLRPPFNR